MVLAQHVNTLRTVKMHGGLALQMLLAMRVCASAAPENVMNRASGGVNMMLLLKCLLECHRYDSVGC